MGIDVIKLNDVPSAVPTAASSLDFAWHHIPQPAMSIWMMTAHVNKPIFPWWTYNTSMDEDLRRLQETWNITDPQSFFDFLFFSQLKKVVGAGLYVIFPGYLRTHSWGDLSDSARATFLRGQGCVYRLDSSYNGKMDIRWVPFAQPQSMVKDPSFEALWSLFSNGRAEDVANSIGFFSVSDVRKLPEIIPLLVQPHEQRSVKLSAVVDWYGVYSSPVTPGHAAAAVVYAREKAGLAAFAHFQERFQRLMTDVRAALASELSPNVVLRFLSRLVAM